jgi:hypothetical protein
MPGRVWGCYAGSPRRDLFAEWRFFWVESELTVFVGSVGRLFAIEREAFVPRLLSSLLGVLHLFAPLGIVIVERVSFVSRDVGCFLLTVLFLSSSPWIRDRLDSVHVSTVQLIMRGRHGAYQD